MICILLAFVLVLLGCSAASISPRSTSAKSLANISHTHFNYCVVQEAGKYYLHKPQAWATNGKVITFKCSVCGNTIRVPEENVTMYEKVTTKSAWEADVNVCSGSASDWQDLLNE